MKFSFPSMILAVLAFQPTLWAEQRVEELRSIDPDATVEIEIISGSLEINGWERDEISIRGSIGDDVESLEVVGGANGITIEVEIPEGWGNRRRKIDAHLQISVPATARLEVETISAPVVVKGLSGVASIATVSGGIDLSGSMRRATIETISGNIEVEGEQTRVEAESVSGSIRLSGVAETVEVATVSGGMKIAAGSIARARLESVSGTIAFSGSLQGEGRLDAEAHSGGVVVELPADLSARFDVETFSGSIDNEFGPAAERSDRYSPGRWLKFTTGNGEAEINIESFSGTIAIKKL